MYINDELNFADNVFIAPNTNVVGKVTIDENSSVWFQSVLRGDVDEIIIGKNCNIQDACVIHCVESYPVKMGNNVSLGHGVILHGCTIGNNVLVGMRATILTGAVIGDNCLIAAGALVSENMVIPDNSLVIGMPAKVKKEINDSQMNLINKTALNYVEYSKMYMKKYGK